MEKRKTFWLGCSGDSFIEMFDRKPMGWDKGGKSWQVHHWNRFLRRIGKIALKDTGVKLPRKNSKQLIPFHIIPAEEK